MQPSSICQFVVVVALAVVSVDAVAYPTVYPTGTTIYYPNEAHSSYILISDHTDLGNHPSASVRAAGKVPDDIRLIDMNVNVVHTWKVAANFNKCCRLMPNGHLFYAGPDNTIVEYDWDSNVVWKHETEGYANIKFCSKTMGSQDRLPNSNTYIAEDNTGRLFQVTRTGKIVWEFVNRGGTTRPSVVPYDFTPQLRAIDRPVEKRFHHPSSLSGI